MPESPDYSGLTEEYVRIFRDENVPVHVREACACLPARHIELFFWMPESSCVGRRKHVPGLYATDLLKGLVAALRTKDWAAVVYMVSA